jgi:acyl-CoA reductase-like NAD-dependent aldehyde dehydrogenase
MSPELPFGGVKRSDAGELSELGIKELVKQKMVPIARS